MKKERIAFIVKGTQRKKQVLEKWLPSLKNFFRVEVFDTEYAKHAMDLARTAVDNGIDKIVSVGGDGTLHEVINGILTSSDPSVPCMFVPAGTANDWGKTFPPPGSLDEIHRRLLAAGTYTDVGQIEMHTDGQTHQRYFINIADSGMGAEVVRRVSTGNWGFSANMIFFKAILQTFFSYTNQEIRCHADGILVYEDSLRLLAVANGKYFGSGICIAPHADPRDGKFQVIIVGDVSVWDYLKYLPALRQGKSIMHPKVHYLAASEIKIEAKSISTEADGEYIGQGSVTFSLIPKAIRLL